MKSQPQNHKQGVIDNCVNDNPWTFLPKAFAILTLLFLIFLLFAFVYCRSIEIMDEIEICKSNGYDGVKFTSPWTTQVECSNFTESEKLGVR